MSPIFFDGAVADGAAIGVPSGSRILVQVHNSANQPSFTVINREQRLEQFAKQTWRAETVVESDQRIPTELTVTLDGDQLIQLPIVIVPDEPPLITFATPPSATPRAALRLHFTVADDYGVERVQADITRPEASATDAVRGIELNLPLSGRRPKYAGQLATERSKGCQRTHPARYSDERIVYNNRGLGGQEAQWKAAGKKAKSPVAVLMGAGAAQAHSWVCARAAGQAPLSWARW